MKLLLAASSLALLSGCCGNELYYVDSRFTPDEEQAISVATDMWCTKTHNALCMDLVFGSRVDVNETKRNAIVKAGTRAAQYRFRDCVERKSSPACTHPGSELESTVIIVLYERMAPEHLQVAMAHEMGHAHGILTHSSDPRAIMYKDLTGAESKIEITCSDLRLAELPCTEQANP